VVGRPLVVLGALMLALLGAGPASAAAPTEVTAQLTDRTVLLSAADRTAVHEAVNQLAGEHDIGLYVVFVSTFDSLPAEDWAEQTAQLSELDESDMLLAVAVGGEGYEYAWWVDEAFPLLEVDIQAALSSKVEPKLEAENWTDVVITLAEQLQSLAEGTDGAAGGEIAEEAAAPQWSPTTIVVIIGGIAVVFLGAHLLSRRRTVAGSSQ
jgi:uncharacterized membrane protein YgcG